jgi:hypothetical protein
MSKKNIEPDATQCYDPIKAEDRIFNGWNHPDAKNSLLQS